MPHGEAGGSLSTEQKEVNHRVVSDNGVADTEITPLKRQGTA
jgi:hypothetical protein